jgi:lipoprotein signal peptidase
MSWNGSLPRRSDEHVGSLALPSSRQRRLLVWIVAAVVVVDQVTKWWAWRHTATVWINSGGNAFTSSRVDWVFGDHGAGAAVDVVGALLLALSACLLLRRRRRTGVLIGGTLVVAGWASNVLDRLWMHHWTAPGSVRGAVDFIVIKVGALYDSRLIWNINVADVGIGSGAVVLFGSLIATAFGQSGYAHWPRLRRVYRRRTCRLRWFVLVAVGMSVVIVVAVVGSTRCGGAHEPSVAAADRELGEPLTSTSTTG